MNDNEINLAIGIACGKTCASCNNTGIMRKWGHALYSEMRQSHPEWIERWPEKEPDIECKHPTLPAYSTDLNAMAEAEATMDQEKLWVYSGLLDSAVFDAANRLMEPPILRWKFCASARQRAESFLRTIGKWKE